MKHCEIEGQMTFGFLFGNIFQEPQKKDSSKMPKKKKHSKQMSKKKNLQKKSTKNYFQRHISFARKMEQKWENNLKAIRILKMLKKDKATAEQQEILAAYEGWGGLASMFDEKDKEEELLHLVEDDNIYQGIRSSILSSYYTSEEIIFFMYKVLEYMGVKGKLNILDPSMGTGNFFRLLPENLQSSNLYGVELEKMSAEIAKNLFQTAKIQNCGFEDAQLPENYFDLVVGNVPFGNYTCKDTTYGNMYIHDYFFLKALSLTRPGGIIAMITSKGTMDKRNSICRKILNQNAKLLCAFRLPQSAFENVGAKVTTDILFFQKTELQNSTLENWVETDMEYNPYYYVHPENVLGTMVETNGPYGKRLVCQSDDSLDELMDQILFDESYQNIFHPLIPKSSLSDNSEAIVPAVDTISNMSFGIHEGKLYYRRDSIMDLIDDSKIKGKRILGMIKIKEALKQLIDLELQDIPDEEIDDCRKNLNEIYDDFTAKYGLIHSCGNRLAFQSDSSYYLLCSLEKLDEDRNFKSKADIMNQRTIIPHAVIDSVDNALDALTTSINERGCIDFEYMKSIYSKEVDQIKEELTGHIFKDPESGEYVIKDDYLSGDVREKLKTAKKAAKTDKTMLLNVEALEKAQPKPLKASEIDARLGATWIPAKYIKDFIIEIFHAPKNYFKSKIMDVVYLDKIDKWSINWTVDRYNQTAKVRYGTQRIHGYRILENCLNLKDCKVYDTIEGPNDTQKKVLNQQETMLAMAKQDEIREAFSSWVYLDYERRKDLEDIYNKKFNSIRYRKYDGSFLEIPYINRNINLYEHQKDAIMRILYSRNNALIGHKVGYGKSFTAIAAIMEAKRLKLSEKNVIVVPNPIVEQWGEEFMTLYPTANILVATEKDMQKNRRREFCSKIVTGNYDAVIMSHTQFEKIMLSPQYEEKFIQDQIRELENLLESADQHFTVRDIESKKKKLEVKLEKLRDRSDKDDTIYFEQLGITKLVIDEAHYFKNLFINTKMNNIAGINTSCNAKRAYDMFLKCRYMEEHNRGKGIVFLTGTPISNSMAEIYTMQRYLQLDTLEKLGLKSFDAWASTFGKTKTIMELSPEGSGYRSRTRFTNFIGLPELLSVFKEVADIKVADIPGMDVPTAHYYIEEIEASNEQKEYVATLAARANKIRGGEVDPSEDNMLKITNEGRKLALDQRLVGIPIENPNSKASKCVHNVHKIYLKYPGRTQVIFCDLSTPKSNQFHVYDDIKRKLIVAGIPETEIAYIHEAKTNKQKKDLCKKVDSGKIRILIGSTDKAGTGCNYQSKLIASHDIDCPWRPSDLEQRSGRIIRQGNFNKDVFIFRYVTKNTFDSYLWQTVENKQRYIGQILSEKDIPRRMQEDDMTLSYAEIKASACGNPEIKRQMELTQDVKKLKIQKKNFLEQYYSMEKYIKEIAPNKISYLKTKLEEINQDMKSLQEKEISFDMEILGCKFRNEFKATKFLRGVKGSFYHDRVIGTCNGFEIILKKKNYEGDYQICIRRNHSYEFKCDPNHTNIAYQIFSILMNIPERYKYFKNELNNEERKFQTAKLELNPKFPYEDELIHKEKDLAEINLKLSA